MLSPADRLTAEIARVREVIERRREKWRDLLEANQDETTTFLLRGRIRECKELLALLAPAQPPTPDAAAGIVGFQPDHEHTERWS